ncbi:glutathione synthase [Rickettsiales bacterium]|nr:glutathione synthase [Rickettsiales bacterium]
MPVVLFQMDPLEKINKETDSTYLLALESLKRGYISMYCNPEDVLINHNKLIIYASKLELKNNMIKVSKIKKSTDISKFDVVLIRQDPPFNMKYITNTYFLGTSNHNNEIKPFFINNPNGIRNFSEKIYPLYFKEFIPDTTITCKESIISAFIKKYKKIVVKPLYEKGGEGIFMIDEKKKGNKKKIRKSTENFTKPLIFQKYLRGVKKGDKRILLINGKPVGCVNRVPIKGSFIANLHLGSKAEKTGLTTKEIQICRKLEPSLKENGFFFVGIDIIDQKLTEINVTSPTGIKQINELSGIKIEEKFWDEVLKTIS